MEGGLREAPARHGPEHRRDRQAPGMGRRPLVPRPVPRCSDASAVERTRRRRSRPSDAPRRDGHGRWYRAALPVGVRSEPSRSRPMRFTRRGCSGSVLWGGAGEPALDPRPHDRRDRTPCWSPRPSQGLPRGVDARSIDNRVTGSGGRGHSRLCPRRRLRITHGPGIVPACSAKLSRVTSTTLFGSTGSYMLRTRSLRTARSSRPSNGSWLHRVCDSSYLKRTLSPGVRGQRGVGTLADPKSAAYVSGGLVHCRHGRGGER